MKYDDLPGTQVSAPIVPSSLNDSYPTHYSIYGKGGYKEVQSINDMNSIPKERLTNGTLVYVELEDTIYKYNEQLNQFEHFLSTKDISNFATKDLLTKLATLDQLDQEISTRYTKDQEITKRLDTISEQTFDAFWKLADTVFKKQDKLPEGQAGQVLKWDNGWKPGTDEKGVTTVNTDTRYRISMRSYSSKNQVVLTDSNNQETVADIVPASEVNLGMIRTGYQQNGKNYPVQLDSNSQAFVNVPWLENQGSGTVTESVSQYKEFIFKRSATKPDTPVGGTYQNPIPNGWSNGVPDGTDLVWFSTKIFALDNSNYGTWSTPSVLADSSTMDVCYSSQEAKPNAPTTHGNQNDSVWSNIGDSNSVWMAMSIKVNGVWGDWSIVKIKGERGTDGTSIKIVGVYNDSVIPNLSIDNLLNVSNVDDSEIVWTKTPHTKQQGDCLKVKGGSLDSHIIYLSDVNPETWYDLGTIKGDSQYIHIKYSNNIVINSNGKNTNPNAVLTANNGETPGDWIGIYTDSKESDSNNISDYTWKYIKGKDAFNIWYFYTKTTTDTPPVSPLSNKTNKETYTSNQFEYNGVTWYDEYDQLTINNETDYVWKIYLKDNDTNLKWSKPILESIPFQNNSYNILISNDTPVYYDLNTNSLTQGTISWTLYKNGVEDNTKYLESVINGVKANESSHTFNKENIKSIIINVKDSATSSKIIYSQQYVFPILGESRQGIQGCILRNRGGYNSETTYVNQSSWTPTSPDAVRFIDYVIYPAKKVSENDVQKYYIVKDSAPKNSELGYSSFNNIVPTNTLYWKEATELDFTYIQNLIANQISATTVSSNEVLVKRKNENTETIIAGITKGNIEVPTYENVVMFAGNDKSTITDVNTQNQDLKDSKFIVYEDGSIKATTGKIAGFTFGDGYICNKSVKDGVGFSASNDMLTVGNSKCSVLQGIIKPIGTHNIISQSIKNNIPNTDSAYILKTNIGSYIDVTGGDRNYAVWAKNGVIRGPQIFSDTVNLVNISATNYDIDFSKGNVIVLNKTYGGNSIRLISLPTESEIAGSLGYYPKILPSNFGMILYISVIGQGAIRFDENTTTIWDNNHNKKQIDMANGDFIMLLATKVTGAFEYRLLTLSIF